MFSQFELNQWQITFNPLTGALRVKKINLLGDDSPYYIIKPGKPEYAIFKREWERRYNERKKS